MADFRFRRFEVLPVIIKNLLIINGLVFLAQMAFEHNQVFSIDNFFALHDVRSQFFKPHQLVTYMFLHGGFGHIFLNMLALWMFGSNLENVWGPKRFLIFYMACGIGAGLLHLGVLYYENIRVINIFNQLLPEQQQELLNSDNYRLDTPTVGASGAVFGCLAAFGYLFPNSLIYVYALIPIKAKWFVLIYGGFELIAAMQNSAGDNVAHWAHLGGAIVGFVLVYIWNKTNRRNFY
jgi:membrane associated rhomboid family serine protease